ncbi:MAG: hypothetical protein JKY54_00380, partial [Flavobacteriales bacterium]|nr:hypothetical protein [Flavobacteriales bacterium]
LLDDILKGDDPRYGMAVKHSSPSPASKGDDPSQSSPAPAAVVIISKMDMVDGISGATVAEHQDKFVPGALYTTYTLWDLANSHRGEMERYSRSKLFPIYQKELLSSSACNCRRALVHSLLGNEENGFANLLMQMMDTANHEFLSFCLNQIDYQIVGLDTVQSTLGRIYKESNIDTKQLMLDAWKSEGTSNENIEMIIASIGGENHFFQTVLNVINWQTVWPKSTISKLIEQIDHQLTQERKQAIFNVIITRNFSMSKSDIDRVRKVKRKYDL